VHLGVQRLHMQAVEFSSELLDIQSDLEYDNSFLREKNLSGFLTFMS